MQKSLMRLSGERMGYYQRVFRYAARLWMKRLRDGRQKLIGFILQTTIIFAVVYYFPIFGDLASRAGEVGTVVISVLASGALYFFYDLWRSPVLIDEYQREDIGICLEAANDIMASEEKLKALGVFHAEGRDILAKNLPYNDLLSAYQDWNERCEAYIEDHFVYAKLHDFRNSKPSQFPAPQVNHPQLRARADTEAMLSAKVVTLDRTISLGGDIAVMPSIRMNHIIERSKHPIYRFLAPIQPGTEA